MGDAPQTSLLIDPSGQVVERPAEDLRGLATLGYSPASPSQIADYQRAQKFGTTGQAAIAAAEHAGSALTFGLSTAAERALGVSAEDIEAREKENPTASTLGTGVGIAAPLLLTGGAAGAAEGANALRAGAELTAPALISRAGQAVTRGVEGLLPNAAGLGGKIAARAAAAGAGSAIEGAAYGLGQVVHEAALGDPNLTAQSALATVGLSAALGGGLGALAGAGEVAIPAALEKARLAAEKVIGKASGETEALIPKALSAASGQPKEKISELLARRAELLDQDPQAAKKVLGDLRDSVQEHYDAVEGALKTANRDIRPVESEGLVASADPVAAKRTYLDLQDKFQQVRDEMLSKPEIFGSYHPAKLEEIRSSLWRDYGADMTPAEAFQTLNKVKKLLDPLAKFGKDVTPQTGEAVGAIRTLRADIKNALEKEDVWGQAGARQAAFNDAQNEYFQARGQLQKRFMEKGPTRSGGVEYTMKPDVSPAQLAKRGEILDAYHDASKKMLDQIELSHRAVPSVDFDREALQSLVNKSSDVTAQARQQASLQQLVKDLSPGQEGGVGTLGELGLGHAIFGPFGTAVAAGRAVMRAGRNVPATVATLARLERMAQSITNHIDLAASALVKGGERAGAIGRGEVAAGIAKSFGHNSEDASALYARRAAEVNRLADPNQMQEALTKQTDGLHDHAPNTAQAMQVASSRGIAFLASKVPNMPKLGPLAPKLTPSQTEISKFNRYYEAVNRPTSVLKQAAAGTLTPEAVEALKTVYPDLYQHIQSRVLEKLSKHADNVPYQSKLMLGMLLGQDMDGSTHPASILANQKALTGPSAKGPENQTGGGIRPTAKGLGKIGVSNRYLTPMQASARRGERE